MKKIVILASVIIILLGGVVFYKYYPGFINLITPKTEIIVKVESEESITIDAVKKIGPSVVTVIEKATTNSLSNTQGAINLGPFTIQIPNNEQTFPAQPVSIGSGFIVSASGLIVTNKHVVSDVGGKYQVITSDNTKYDVSKIYRDPLNDVAILKINPKQNSKKKLAPVIMGNSSRLQVGQFVIAIGTALGEFRNTVTTGVVSGLGRGIQAGDQFAGYAEKLDNVIQTSAPINPGNSGGPLVDSNGRVIGVNTATAQSGQNIGFALPINVIKQSLSDFNATGQFSRAFLGVEYKTINMNLAVLNNIPVGAYVENVLNSSPAQKAGIQIGDIIMNFNSVKLDKNNDLATLISKKRAGDSVNIVVWRNGQTQDIKVTLSLVPN